MTKVNMNEVCREDFIFYDLVTSKGFHVHIDIPERNIYALGNVEVLGRVLNNLISNAITYGDDGKTLGMTLRDDETNVYIDVWDTGKELMNRILIKCSSVCTHLKIQEIDCTKGAV